MDNSHEKLHIKIEARIIYQLGLMLIPDELTALLEVIKNSYDADSTVVNIVIDTKKITEYGNGIITISDNGNGMTPFILDSAFMTLATSFKEHVKISPVYKRRAVGSKGIGRLSTQRLGRHLFVRTNPRIEQLKMIKNFTIKDIDSDEIKNKVFNLEMDWGQLNSEKEISNFTGDFYSTDKVTSDRYGTEIVISGLNNIGYWNIDQWKINRIKSEIFGMTNIFSSVSRDKFRFNLKIDNKVITNDSIDEDVLKVTSDSYLDFNFINWKLEINLYKNERYIKRRYNEFIKKMKADEFELVDGISIDELIKKYSYQKYVIDFLDLENLSESIKWFNSTLDIDITKSMEYKNTFANPGSFNGYIYAIDKSSESWNQLENLFLSLGLYKKQIRLKKELQDIWNNATGFYLFRDSFRILPYGKTDWAGFDKIAMTSTNNIFKSQNLSGFISIDGESSGNLKEQTNRSGLVEDSYGRNFYSVINKYLLPKIAEMDKEFRNEFSLKNKNEGEIAYSLYGTFKFKYTKQSHAELDFNGQFDSFIKKIEQNQPFEVIEEAKKEIIRSKQNLDTSIVQNTKLKQNELNQIKEIFPLAAQGIVVESMSHELLRVENGIRTISNSAKSDLKNELYFDNHNKLKIHHTSIHNQIIDHIEIIRDSLNHILPMSKNKLNYNEKIDIFRFLQETYSTNNPIFNMLTDNRIKLSIEGNSFFCIGNQGILITIFDNLFLNSIYWLSRTKPEEREINILVLENGKILFSDNGKGFDEDIIEVVFEPFISRKEMGRGLGLFISKEMVEMLNGTINLDKDNRNKYGLVNTIIIELEVYK